MAQDLSPELLEAARRAFNAHEPPAGPRPAESELAVSVFDSLLDGIATPESHWLRFEHAVLGIDVHVTRRDTATEVSGEVQPAGAVRAALYLEGTSLAIVADIENGWFTFSPVGHGLVRLAVEDRNSGPTIWTDWFRI